MENNYKQSGEYRAVRVVWAVGLVALMLIEGVMFGSKYTRRSADELVKINTSTQSAGDQCYQSGGLWDDYNQKCNPKEKNK